MLDDMPVYYARTFQCSSGNDHNDCYNNHSELPIQYGPTL